VRRVTRRLLREQQGASTVIVALCMTALLILVALVVDIGATAARKAQLQDAADAAALTIAQRCFDDWDAKAQSSTNDLVGCNATVLASAKIEAIAVANDHFGNGADPLALSFPEAPSLNSVALAVTSSQDALFSFATGTDELGVAVDAVAEWQLPAIAVPLALNSCVLDPTTPEQVAFVGSGIYDGVGTLLDAVLKVLDTLSDLGNLPDFLDGVLACGTNVAAGGWLTNSGTENCEYAPNLFTTLGAVLNRLLPVDRGCIDALDGALGKRIIVPVYNNSTFGLLGQLAGQAEPLGYAEILLTGYEFETALGSVLSGRQSDHLGADTPGCRDRLSSLLNLGTSGAVGLTNAAIDAIDLLVSQIAAGLAGLIRPVLLLLKAAMALTGGVTDGLLVPVLDATLGVVTSLLGLCQGVQGHVLNPLMTEEEATAALTPYRLVA